MQSIKIFRMSRKKLCFRFGMEMTNQKVQNGFSMSSIFPFNQELKQIRFSFSEQIKNSLINKLINKEDEDPQKLKIILKDLAYLNQGSAQLGLKMIIKKIYNGVHSLDLLKNENFLKVLCKYPESFIETHIFKIKSLLLLVDKEIQDKKLKEKSQINKIMNEINELFVKAFQYHNKQTNKSVNKSQIALYKRFADYHFLYLSRLVAEKDKYQILNKSLSFYKSCFSKANELIFKQKQRFDDQEKKPLEKSQTEENRNIKINAIKQNIRLLIQSNGEVIFHVFLCNNQLRLYNQNQNTKMQQPNQINFIILPDLARALQNYQLFKQITKYSIYYHKIKKIYIDIDYSAKIEGFKKFNQDKNQIAEFERSNFKKYSDQMNLFYKQTSQDIDYILKNFKNITLISNLTQILFTIRINLLNKNKKYHEDRKNFLAIQIKLILDLFNQDADIKKQISIQLAQLMKQALEKNVIKPESKSI